MISLKVNDKRPGDEIRLDSPGELTVQASVAAQVPLDRVELMVNGQAVYSASMAEKHHRIQTPLPVNAVPGLRFARSVRATA